MKKTMLLNTSLLLVLAFWLMPSAFSQNRKVQTHQEQTTMWSVPGTVTVSYYLDDEGNVIRHGRQLFSCKFDNTARRSPGVDARKVVIEGYIDYKDDYRDGGINVSFEFFENGNKANAKVNGTFKNDLMDGTWNVLGLQGVSSTFTIKDRRVISFKVNNGKNGAFTSDAQGKLSGTLDENVMKNGIVINTMKYKSGIESTELTPKAKTMLAQLSKREVSSKELVENGFYLEELGETFNLYTFVAAALEQFSEIVKVDQDLNKPNYCSLLCQIKDSQWASFEQCKKLLDEAQKKSGFSAMDELADRMITNYNDGNGHYLNPEVVQSVENYKSTAKEQWFENIKRDINSMNDLSSLGSYCEKLGNDIKALPNDKQNQFNDMCAAKRKDLIANTKRSIEQETDYFALINYYETTVKPSKQYMDNIDASALDSSYQGKKGELENACKADILTKISLYNASKDLKQYYDGLRPTLAQLKDSSSIQSAYNNKYNELKVKEDKAAKRAERKQKIITGAKWVGGVAVVVGGYLLAKRYGLLEKE